MTQAEVASIVGSTQDQISCYETGYYIPSANFQVRWAIAVCPGKSIDFEHVGRCITLHAAFIDQQDLEE